MKRYKDGKIIVVSEEKAEQIRAYMQRYERHNNIQSNKKIKELENKIMELSAKLAEPEQ